MCLHVCEEATAAGWVVNVHGGSDVETLCFQS